MRAQRRRVGGVGKRSQGDHLRDVIGTIAAQLGLKNAMFEAADPDVFA